MLLVTLNVSHLQLVLSFFNEETFDLNASHKIHRKLGSTSLVLMEPLLFTSLSEQKLEILFPIMKKHQYFQESGKFHTIFHSFAFPKAFCFPGGAGVTLPVSVLA